MQAHYPGLRADRVSRRDAPRLCREESRHTVVPLARSGARSLS
jgi:hypothetical protein